MGGEGAGRGMRPLRKLLHQSCQELVMTHTNKGFLGMEESRRILGYFRSFMYVAPWLLDIRSEKEVRHPGLSN